MISIKVVSPDQLDFGAYVHLQKSAYADLLKQTKASGHFMTPEFYRWKYSPPAGDAKIAVIYEEGELAAANAMFPLLIHYQDQIIHGWQSCDTATLPSGRGKGYFFKCLHALIEELQEGELFFGFPNRNSMRGFKKIGWSEIRDLTTWIKPIIVNLRMKRNSNIIEVEQFSDRQDSLNQILANSGYSILDRGAKYMNWRYVNHPVFSYRIFAYDSPEGRQGAVVFRQANIMGRDWAIVMDLWGIKSSIERDLLREASVQAKRQKLSRMVMLNTGLSFYSGLSTGFVPVPSWMTPKRNILMGSAKGGIAEALLNAKWSLRTGDWDVF